MQNRPHTNSTSAGDAPVFISMWECRELLNPHTAGSKRKLSDRTGPACRSLVTKPRTLFFAKWQRTYTRATRRTLAEVLFLYASTYDHSIGSFDPMCRVKSSLDGVDDVPIQHPVGIRNTRRNLGY